MEEINKNKDIIQYVPFTSFVHPSFWHTLTESKLNIDRLDENTKQIYGKFTYRDDIGTVFEVDGTSFNKTAQDEMMYIHVTGTVINKNKIQDFKNLDKAALLNSIGEVVWSNIKRLQWIDNPNSLLSFVILSFADLKKYHYYYWFAFPSPSQPTVYLKNSELIKNYLNNKELNVLAEAFKSLDEAQKCFFVVKKEMDVHIQTLSTFFGPLKNGQEININNAYFAFADPSNGINPGWPLRMFLAVFIQYCPNICNSTIQVIGLRSNVAGSIENSRIFHIHISQNVQTADGAGWVGWERNDKGNFGPRLANMSASMDPLKIADTSSDLNIKLMKWRLVPDIDVDVMKTTKCLLLGAGTLGCHVARNLLAWGFRHITFLDNGKVSYSNPTRQVLFYYQDCLGGGREKAVAAAENLRLILPTVESRGLVTHIPMPGHPVGESFTEETLNSIQMITAAIADHDVIFLLLDTREARWLPTLLAAHYGKIVINAALGFDSYLVMRHGVGMAPEEDNSMNKAYLPGGEVGCYFCNDVTAPGDSLKDRTLDQQCTVTRPGVAAIAGALAVEVLVALLQHPLRIQAPAPYNISDDGHNNPDVEGVLGPVPHSIRGFLHSYQAVVPTCAKFKQCIACSDLIINKYKNEGIDFLLNVFNSGNYLEEVTGLAELHLTAEMTDILTLSDEDQDS